ncbi:TPA: hypothetical protein HA265_01510 [Candidatus Woesearchaeota archaeon]|nr:hypothetical protein [Candidatus Woesearchaeota archaeon]
MGIKERLEQYREPLSALDLSSVVVAGSVRPDDLRGRIAEHFVHGWLSRAGLVLDEDFPRSSDGYDWTRSDHGIIVREGRRVVHEYDFLAGYGGCYYVVEVKSFKLNGLSGKIPQALGLASRLYDGEVGMLIFFPQYCNKRDDALRLESDFPSVICVDSGYKKKHLLRAVRHCFALIP